MLPRTLLAAAPLVALLAACNDITGVNGLVLPGGSSGAGAGSGSGAGNGGSSGAGAGGAGQGGAGAGGTTTGPVLGAATGVTITQVAIYQGPKRLLMGGTQSGVVTVPVVAGRDALVRVFVQTDGSYDHGPVTAHLFLGQGSKPLEVVAPAPASSSEAQLGSTINFNVPGASIVPGVTYRVELTEQSSKAPFPAASYPQGGGFDPLGSCSDGAQLKVVVVPVQYQADGSNRLPDTSASQLQHYKDAFFATYPIDSINLTVHAPFPWPSVIGPDGTGWSELLSAIADYRQQQGTPPDVYFFGAFVPDASFAGFCGGGCVAGLGMVGAANDTYSRAAIGLGYVDPTSYTTIIHEIGHTQGRQHSPCGGAASPDPNYPYANADIGDWGYNLVTKQLYAPGKASDMMGYCNPVWISDYTFNAIFQRIKTVNGAKILYPPELLDRVWERARLDMHGNLVWLPPIQLATPPEGQSTTVTVQSAGGAQAISGGQFFPYDHIAGGELLWPPGASAASSIQVALGGLSKTLSR